MNENDFIYFLIAYVVSAAITTFIFNYITYRIAKKKETAVIKANPWLLDEYHNHKYNGRDGNGYQPSYSDGKCKPPPKAE